MPIIVGILTFMSRINFSLSRAEHEKSFITSGPGSEAINVFMLNSAEHKICKFGNNHENLIFANIWDFVASRI